MGKVWGINHTSKWLTDRGVPNTFFSVDSDAFEVAGATDALVASSVHERLLKSLGDIRIRVFDMFSTHDGGLYGGSTSATYAPSVAAHMGYTDVSFFGCDCSFEESDHVDRNTDPSNTFLVRAGGRDYKTIMPLMLQAQELAWYITEFPRHFHNRSEGLLRGMLEHPDTWEVVAISRGMKEHLAEVNGVHWLNAPEYTP